MCLRVHTNIYCRHSVSAYIKAMLVYTFPVQFFDYYMHYNCIDYYYSCTVYIEIHTETVCELHTIADIYIICIQVLYELVLLVLKILPMFTTNPALSVSGC